MKMIVKKVMSTLLIGMIFILWGCGCKDNKYSDHSFAIIIKSDYEKEYKDGLFGLDDFNYDNILTYSYTIWSEKSNSGTIFIFLKTTGDEEVNKAIDHFNRLKFVKKCEKIELVNAQKKTHELECKSSN